MIESSNVGCDAVIGETATIERVFLVAFLVASLIIPLIILMVGEVGIISHAHAHALAARR